jgi:hypothetical protein
MEIIQKPTAFKKKKKFAHSLKIVIKVSQNLKKNYKIILKLMSKLTKKNKEIIPQIH